MKTWIKGFALLFCMISLCGCGKTAQSSTEAPQPVQTDAPTQPPTEAVTQKPTEKVTEPPAAPPTEKPAPVTEPETEPPTEKRYDDWQSAYSDAMDAFLQSGNSNIDRAGYALQDLNNDGIPEMILFDNEYSFRVYTFYDGEAVWLRDITGMDEIFYSEDYQLIQVCYVMTYSHVNVWYRIQNGTVEEVASAVHIIDENPDPEVPESYMANREDVTKEEYDRVMEEYGGNDPSYQKIELRKDFSNAFAN